MSRRQHNYTEAERHEGLFAVALCDGNTRRALSVLALKGLPIPATTLDTWKRAHAGEYSEIRQTVLPRIRERVEARAEGLVEAARGQGVV